MAKQTSRNSPSQRTTQSNGQNQSNVQMSWSGPLPPPGALQQFDAIIPDGANRIMAMIEEEQKHRISQESAGLAAMASDTKRGHWLGAIISIAAILGAVVSVYLHAPAAVSIALVGIPVLGMIRAIVGSKTK